MKFIVNSAILLAQLDPVACNTAVPKMLKTAGFKDIQIKT
jgi:hypothetical protein